MFYRLMNTRTFFQDSHDAAAGVPSRSEAVTKTLAAGEALVIGPGHGAWGAVSAIDGGGTLTELKTFSVTNVVVTNAAAPDAETEVTVANDLKDAVTVLNSGVALPRIPVYLAAVEAQKVIANIGAAPVQVSTSWEETGLPGFVNGGHPGRGSFTLPLGAIDPAEYDAGDMPLRFRVQPGRGFVITGAAAYSVTPIAVTGGTAELTLERSDGANVTSAAFDLDGLATKVLTAVPVEADAADRTVSKDQYVDIVVTLDAFVGTAGDVIVELYYDLL